MTDDPAKAASIAAAAQWQAECWHVAPQPVTRTLRQMFGLALEDAVKAMAEAKRIIDRQSA